LIYSSLDCLVLRVIIVRIRIFTSVAGWLDDIGLPQYKDQFTEARIDGRMLHCLTIVRIAYTYNISLLPIN